MLTIACIRFSHWFPIVSFRHVLFGKKSQIKQTRVGIVNSKLEKKINVRNILDKPFSWLNITQHLFIKFIMNSNGKVGNTLEYWNIVVVTFSDFVNEIKADHFSPSRKYNKWSNIYFLGCHKHVNNWWRCYN